MRIAWWAGFLGTGVVLSGSLGACGGYSSLGEVPGGGGEAGTDDGVGGGMSMGAKGGQGRGGTRATGGANGMGAVGGTGMGAVGGTGMGAVAGTEMGMGAVGGGSEPVLCMTDSDCPQPPPNCNMCADGTAECIRAVCNNGECGVEEPSCPNETNLCMTDADCPQPTCVPGAACPVSICITGTCATTLPSPDGRCACGNPCMRPDGTPGACDAAGQCHDYEPMCAPSSVLDFATVMCGLDLDDANTPDAAAADFLNSTCARSFCHGKNFVVGLDLRPDSGFAQRLLDAPARHSGIPCPDDVTTECVPDTCPAPGTVKLIDSADPMASWILTTTHADHVDCGERMPYRALTPEEDACLTGIVNATAALK